MSRASALPVTLLALALTAPVAFAGDGTYGPPPEDAPEAQSLWNGGFVVSVKFAPGDVVVFGTLKGKVYRWDLAEDAPERIGEVPARTGPEWGLTGVAVPPDFEETGDVLVAYTTGPDDVDPASDDARGTMRVVRLHDGGETTLFEYPAFRSHNGGRILVHEGLLYLGTGDRKQEAEVDEPGNHVGKILRMTLEGDPAPGNPALPGWDPYVYSLGHRNPFGLAWDEGRDRLVESEPGQYESEEINAILPGRHYGWPHCAGPCEPDQAAYQGPLVHYPEVITPVGLTVVGDDYYVGAYNTGEIRRAYEGPDGWTDEVVFKHTQGILDVEASPQKAYLYYGSWNGLWRIPTPEVSLATVDDDAGATEEGRDGNETREGEGATGDNDDDGRTGAGFQDSEPQDEVQSAPAAPVAWLLLATAGMAGILRRR